MKNDVRGCRPEYAPVLTPDGNRLEKRLIRLRLPGEMVPSFRLRLKNKSPSEFPH